MEITETKTEQISQQLLGLIAEELKAPLALVARASELAELTKDTSAITGARASAEAALQLVSSYALGLKLANLGDNSLALEPIAIGAVMAEARAELAALAEAYDVSIELELANNLKPVLACQQVLAAALASTGRCLIGALAASPNGGQLTLKLVASRSRYGIVTGWYWQADKITSEALKRAKSLLATSRQPLTALANGQASGVFVADMLLKAMDSQLRVGKYRHWTGLATTLQPSSQLSLTIAYE